MKKTKFDISFLNELTFLDCISKKGTCFDSNQLGSFK